MGWGKPHLCHRVGTSGLTEHKATKDYRAWLFSQLQQKAGWVQDETPAATSELCSSSFPDPQSFVPESGITVHFLGQALETRQTSVTGLLPLTKGSQRGCKITGPQAGSQGLGEELLGVRWGHSACWFPGGTSCSHSWLCPAQKLGHFCCLLCFGFVFWTFIIIWEGSSVHGILDFSRQEYRSGMSFPSPGALPDPGIKPTSPALTGRFFTTKQPGKPNLKLSPN